MYKEGIICFIVILIVIISDVITQNYTKNSIEFMDKKLETFKIDLIQEEKQKENINEEMDDVMRQWRKRYEKLAYYIEHDELEKVETELTSLKANIEVENYEEGIPDLEKSIFILNHIKEKFKLDIKNIF